MQLELIPLLKDQRDLYSIPRGQERFRAYLETMMNTDGSDVEFLPMVTMNPMGKEHISTMLDTLLAMDAEAVAAGAIADASNPLSKDPGVFKVGLVVADDLMGGWTNRYTCEFSDRFEVEPRFKRGWLSVVLWTSEPPSAQQVREATLTTLHRAAYIQRHGVAHTLQEMLNQEGYAMTMAGCGRPTLDTEDIDYTREVISPYLSNQDYPTLMACLFGDRAAQLLGYTPQGLSERAGLALACHQANAHYPKRYSASS